MPRSETGRSSRYAESRVVLAPSRSWTLAASTTTTMSNAQGVGDDEPLPAVDLLAGVVTTAVASDGVRALDALRVDDPGAGLGIAALLHPGLLPQRGQHHLGDFGLLPLLEIPVHGLPRREVSRQVSPGAASPHHVQDSVHNGPAWMLLRPATSPRRRQQRPNQRPLLVGQVRGGTAAAETPGHPDGVDVHGHADTPTKIQ